MPPDIARGRDGKRGRRGNTAERQRWMTNWCCLEVKSDSPCSLLLFLITDNLTVAYKCHRRANRSHVHPEDFWQMPKKKGCHDINWGVDVSYQSLGTSAGRKYPSRFTLGFLRGCFQVQCAGLYEWKSTLWHVHRVTMRYITHSHSFLVRPHYTEVRAKGQTFSNAHGAKEQFASRWPHSQIWPLTPRLTDGFRKKEKQL